MSKSFLITRTGNKKDDIKYFTNLLPLDIDNVVEPFGGSFAVIREVYNDPKYNKYVNDNDDMLYYIYKNPKELIKGYEKWNEIFNKIQGKTKLRIELQNTYLNPFIKKYIYLNNIRFYPKQKNISKIDEDLKLISEINFTNTDALEIIDKFKKKENTFIFLDPPYLDSDVEQYTDNNKIIQLIYYKLNEIIRDNENKSKIMIVVYSNEFCNNLFDGMIKTTYKKINRMNQKYNNYIVVTNY